VEDETLIVMDIAIAFEGSGVHEHRPTPSTLKQAVLLVKADGLSGAILDPDRRSQVRGLANAFVSVARPPAPGVVQV
jgi:hypothetical protein